MKFHSGRQGEDMYDGTGVMGFSIEVMGLPMEVMGLPMDNMSYPMEVMGLPMDFMSDNMGVSACFKHKRTSAFSGTGNFKRSSWLECPLDVCPLLCSFLSDSR